MSGMICWRNPDHKADGSPPDDPSRKTTRVCFGDGKLSIKWPALGMLWVSIFCLVSLSWCFSLLFVFSKSEMSKKHINIYIYIIYIYILIMCHQTPLSGSK